MGWTRYFRRRAWDAERQREIESYIQIETGEGVARGMSPGDARRAALRKFGNRHSVREQIYDFNSVPYFETACRDVAYALRMLSRNKGWTAVALVSLALGIGANTVLFSAIDSALLEPLPVPDPNRLIAFRWVGENSVAVRRAGDAYVAEDPATGLPVGASFPLAAFETIRTASAERAEVFAFASARVQIIDDRGNVASAQYVSGAYYPTLGVVPVRGRLLSPEDAARVR
jgi:hypothetical protein